MPGWCLVSAVSFFLLPSNCSFSFLVQLLKLMIPRAIQRLVKSLFFILFAIKCSTLWDENCQWDGKFKF